MTLDDGQRFDFITSAIIPVTSIGSFLVGYMSIAPRYLGTDTSLLTLILILLAVTLFLLYTFKGHADDRFDDVETNVENVEELISNMDQSAIDRPQREGSDDPRTDGGELPRGDPADIDLDLDDSSGVGALSGLVAGGALGMPWGPAGVILGGIIGGLLGNEAEYQNVKERHQNRIESAAREYLERHRQAPGLIEELETVNEEEDQYGNYWEFVFLDRNGVRHPVRLYIDKERFVIPD